MKQQKSKVALSARYTYPEKEGMTLQSDKMGRADISGWAHATSSFHRPSCNGAVLSLHNPIKSLANLKPVTGGLRQHDPSEVFMPPDSKPDPRLDMGRAAIISEVNSRLYNFCKKRIKKKAKPMEFPKPSIASVLDDCPATDPNELNRLKGVVIERDCELHNDNPLPRERPLKWKKGMP